MTRILPLVLAAVSVALYVLGRHGGAVAALAGAVILLVGRLRRSPSAGNAAPTGAPALNLAFDVTPAALVAAIITDHGVLRPPYEESIPAAFERAQGPRQEPPS